AYERAGLDIRVDHRSHADRGIAQEPTKHLGPSATGMERREPGSSDRGDINRDIEERNAALRERAALEIAATKAQAELAAARQLAAMERAAEAAEREARAAAQGRTDDTRPDRAGIDRQAEQAMQAAHAAAKGRTEDIRTEPAAPIFDREAAEAAWQKQIIDAAAAQAEREARAAARGQKDDIRGPDRQEARQQPEPAAGLEKHGGAEPAQTTPQAPEPGHDLKSPASIGSQIFGGIGKAFMSFIEQLADFLAPPPPPTPDQAERMARAAEEQQEAHARQTAQAEQEAAQHWLIAEAQRQAAREREEEDRFRRIMRDAARAEERDRDRGYERER
ncbi:MAG: MobA/MobL family protein, partial [Acetobacteraceae bacterium]|nr:MobA/MobL family protein [Acetobacteraceae bacterium]